MSYFSQAQSLGHLLQLSCQHWSGKTSHLIPQKGEFVPVAYEELWERVSGFAKVLSDLGLEKGDHLCLFAENEFAWVLLDWAAHTLGIVIAPIYPTLPPDQVAFIVRDAEAKRLIVGSAELKARVESVVEVPIDLLADLAQRAHGQSMDAEIWQRKIDAVRREDLATLIYTSGTTGNPKGVMLSHNNICTSIQVVRETLPITETDTFLSFLPLSHVYERVNGQYLATGIGATLGFAGSLATLSADMVKVRPTIMLCVPRFLDAVRQRILDGVAKAPPVRQKLFRAALGQGVARFVGKPAPLADLMDRLVGKTVRERMGGRIRFFVSGGAALPSVVAEFYGAFRLPVLQGFGMTETTSGICFNLPDRNLYRSIGQPIHQVEMKIAEDGEILVRGPFVMMGYWNRPEETAQTIDSEGWLHTGDIGERWPSGHFAITDRKKDLFKLSNGKYVAPQPVENRLKESPYIAEAVLFGEGSEYVMGVLFPHFEAVAQYVAQHGLKPGSDADLLQLEPVRKLFKSEVDRINKGLADFEKVKRHVVIPSRLSVEGGELTPSLKVKRRVIQSKFEAEIASMRRS